MARSKGARGMKTLERIHALEGFLTPDHPVSVRYCMYTLLSKGLIDSSNEIAAVTTLCRDCRIDGTFDDACFVDNRRRVELVSTWSGLDDYRDWSAKIYKLDYWQDQPKHIECWLEKDTTSFLVQDTTTEWRIPLRVSTGYFSRPFLCRAAEEINNLGIKPIYIVYIGDFDPSGLDIERAAREGNGLEGSLRREGLFDILNKKYDWSYDRFAEQISWKCIGVTYEDFDRLPPVAKIPIKQDESDSDGISKRGDPRAEAFKREYGEFGAEVEALEVFSSGLLAQRVRDAVIGIHDSEEWRSSESKEKMDLEQLKV